MRDDVKDRLVNLFAEDRKRGERIAQERDERAHKAAENLAEFMRLRDAAIEPAMREMVEFIASQGWDSTIEKEDEVSDQKGRTSPASITMTIFRGEKPHYHRSHDYPHFRVSCIKGSGDVAFHASTISPGSGGSSGSAGTASLADVDANLIQSRIADLLGRVLKRLA